MALFPGVNAQRPAARCHAGCKDATGVGEMTAACRVRGPSAAATLPGDRTSTRRTTRRLSTLSLVSSEAEPRLRSVTHTGKAAARDRRHVVAAHPERRDLAECGTRSCLFPEAEIGGPAATNASDATDGRRSMRSGRPVKLLPCLSIVAAMAAAIDLAARPNAQCRGASLTQSIGRRGSLFFHSTRLQRNEFSTVSAGSPQRHPASRSCAPVDCRSALTCR